MAKTKAAVPKRIGGVKLSKPFRRSLKAASKSKTGRVTIAEALAAAAGVLAVDKARPLKAARKPARASKPAAKAAAKPRVKAPAPAAKAKRPPRPGLARSVSADSPAPDIVAPPSGNGAGT